MNYYDWVFVVDKNEKPCVPITNKKAKELIRNKKAVPFNYEPYCIKRIDEHMSEYEDHSDFVFKIDTGFERIGFSLMDNVNEYLAGEVKCRTDISGLLKTRNEHRREKRGRIRHRKNKNLDKKIVNNPTYKNGNEDGWIAPSIEHKIFTHKKLVSQVSKWLPWETLYLETATFDIAKIENPDIEGIDYQTGRMKGFENIKMYVRARDGYECQYPKCESKKNKKNTALEIHHLTLRSKGGSDRPENLICLCPKHHKMVHKNEKTENDFRDMKLGIVKVKSYKAATCMSLIRNRLVSELQKEYTGKRIYEDFGYITKTNRIEAGLPKTHFNDALNIHNIPEVNLCKYVYIVNQKRCNDRCMESFHDAQYIDARDGKKKSGSELALNRQTRSQDPHKVQNDRIYRQEKISKGERRTKNKHHPIKAGDIIEIDGQKYKMGKTNARGQQVVAYSFDNYIKVKVFNESEKGKMKTKTLSDKTEGLLKINQDENVKIIRRRRGFQWDRVDRLEYEEFSKKD